MLSWLYSKKLLWNLLMVYVDLVYILGMYYFLAQEVFFFSSFHKAHLMYLNVYTFNNDLWRINQRLLL